MRVLFICTRNAIRSPMAEAIAQDAFSELDVASAGVDPMDVDGFAISVMAEVGLDLMRHEAQDFSHIADYDLVIALSAQAAATAEPLVGDKLEQWSIDDPSLVDGNRDQRLAAYRHVRETLTTKIKARFAT